MMTEPFETERLHIRSTREADGEFCLDMWLDAEMGRFLSDPPRELADDAELNFAKGIETDDGWYPMIIELKEKGVRIGSCSMVPGNDGVSWDMGYCIHKDYWRRGYATEAIAALIEWGRMRGGRVFTADVARENIGSNAVLTKLGFHVAKTGFFKKRLTDIVYEKYTYRLEV